MVAGSKPGSARRYGPCEECPGSRIRHNGVVTIRSRVGSGSFPLLARGLMTPRGVPRHRWYESLDFTHSEQFRVRLAATRLTVVAQSVRASRTASDQANPVRVQ